MRSSTVSVEPRMPRSPRIQLPEGAWDCHTHVFGPFDAFPVPGPTTYAPPLAPPGTHALSMRRLGTARAVLVQPAPYGTDTRALENALATAPCRLVGIASATSEITDSALERLHAAGVRGLRYVEKKNPVGGGRYPNTVGVDDFFDLAPRLRALGWHPEIWAACADLVKVLPAMTATDMPVVVDHLAGVDVARGIGDGDFRRLLALLREGRVWVKLTLCRNSRDFPDYRDERPFHDAIVEANPDRLVWGSDWPYVRMDDTAPDAGHLVDLFDQWTGGDATLRSKAFVDNPEALYRG